MVGVACLNWQRDDTMRNARCDGPMREAMKRCDVKSINVAECVIYQMKTEKISNQDRCTIFVVRTIH